MSDQADIWNEGDTPELRLARLGWALPPMSEAIGNYLKARRQDGPQGSVIYLSGQGPRMPGEVLYRGKVGREFSLEQAYEAARFTMLALLSTLKQEIGELSRVKQVLRVTGYVNCTEDFLDHPKVINGASDLLVEVFGERGRHARTALGVQQLPQGIPVEIEMIVEV